MSESRNRGGIGLGGVLLCIFVTLKLLGEIQWSWLWVLSPAWIPLAVALGVAALVAMFSGIALGIGAIADWRKRARRAKDHDARSKAS